jgi:hypothetical protein
LAEVSFLALARACMGLLKRRRLEARIVLQDFPARRNQFPVRVNRFVVPGHREFFANPSDGLGNLGPTFAGSARIRRNSLYFPCESGNRAQRRVRSKLPPPPYSLPERRLSPNRVGRLEKTRDSAGFWAIGFPQADRRPRVRDSAQVAARVYLCCPVRRFPLTLDSPERRAGLKRAIVAPRFSIRCGIRCA